MGFFSNLFGAVSQNPVEADTYGNLLVTLPQLAANPGFALVAGQIPGTTGQTLVRPALVSGEGRSHVALDRPVFYCNFAGSATSANAIPQNVLKQTATTMTATAGSPNNGYLILNASNITTVTTGIAYQTYATYETYAAFGTRYEFEAITVNAPQSGSVMELGCGLITSATSVGLLDGFCFRWTSSGALIGVCSVNGTEYQTASFTMPADNILLRFSMVVNQQGVEFYINQVLQGVLSAPASAVGPTFQQNLPVLMRVYNNVAPSLPVQLKVAEMWVTQCGIDWQKPWSQICAGMGQTCNDVPFGTAIGETGGNNLNSAAVPATAAGSNTAALVVGLGGIGRMTAQATNIAAAGDNIATSYQVPVQSATQTSKRLVITGVRISCTNGGAVVATTPTTLVWGLAWGHTSVSLATTDAVGTKAPRHMKLGQMWANIGNVIGQPYDKDLVHSFVTPIVVNPGEFVATTVRFLLGTATASQEVDFTIGFEGYWE